MEALMPDRPEILNVVSEKTFDVVDRPVGMWERFYGNTALRKVVVLIVLFSAWEISARWMNKPLLFPTFSATASALISSVRAGFETSSDRVGSHIEIPQAAATTIRLLLTGYGLGLLLAVLLTVFASATRIGADLLETLTAMFHPLPSIALLPIALIWFGLGERGVIFVLVHAVLWSVALNTHAGFRAVSPTLRMVGRNYGLSTAGFVRRILIPGAFPSILTGLKTGWAFAWRTLIAAELVFGVASRGGGLGRYIDESKIELRIPDVFAGLLTVILFGLFVENLVFKVIEKRTIRVWGMES
jgi:NitT/TauT family transport system permease protein